MAYEILSGSVSLPANADLSASQWCFVNVNSSGKVAVATAGDDAIGVLQDDPAAADRPAQVYVAPCITKVKAGAITTRGGLVASDNTGRAVDAVSGDYILGKFLEAAGAANQIVSILFQPNGKL